MEKKRGKLIGDLLGSMLSRSLSSGDNVSFEAYLTTEFSSEEIPMAPYLCVGGGHVSVQCPHCDNVINLVAKGSVWNCNRCSDKFLFNIDDGIQNLMNTSSIINFDFASPCNYL